MTDKPKNFKDFFKEKHGVVVSTVLADCVLDTILEWVNQDTHPPAPRTDGLFDPNLNDIVFYVSLYGTVSATKICADNKNLINSLRQRGNIYPTKQSAENASKKQRILTKIRRMKGCDPSGSFTVSIKGKSGVRINTKGPIVLGAITFSTFEDASNAVKNMGDDIYWLDGIENE